MKDWKYLTFEQRKVILNRILHNYKLREIAKTLGFAPTNISKEVKRNIESTTVGKNITNCKRTNRWPFVCTGCNKKYKTNVFLQNINIIIKKLKIKPTLI